MEFHPLRRVPSESLRPDPAVQATGDDLHRRNIRLDGVGSGWGPNSRLLSNCVERHFGGGNWLTLSLRGHDCHARCPPVQERCGRSSVEADVYSGPFLGGSTGGDSRA
ncbi:MAG: hypothetical protein MZV64_29745 [Ignavibacteriales bacterium]|nr:hypothetical protein [Ignavibacteriales bacterium]